MNYINVFKALSDITRLRLLYVLVSAKNELCICEIMDVIGIKPYHASRCMKELKNAGLVTERKDGRFVFYKVDNKNGSFTANLYRLLASLPSSEFREDIERMKKRIALRKNGKVIVTMKGCKC
ncbi:MAG: metalloregulator ArsR/SmtB family transcription factor [Elusimicrobiota bacterium]